MPPALTGSALPPAPMPQGVLSAPADGRPPQVSGAPQIPAPSHQETVATLRHFAAIGKQLEIALKDPDLGKADMKDKIIHGMVTLVADRIIPPGQAVSQLATFPERPFDQKQWLIQHYQQAQQARVAVLDHYRMANAPTPQPPSTPSPDNHMQDMAGMMQAHYSGSAQ